MKLALFESTEHSSSLLARTGPPISWEASRFARTSSTCFLHATTERHIKSSNPLAKNIPDIPKHVVSQKPSLISGIPIYSFYVDIDPKRALSLLYLNQLSELISKRFELRKIVMNREPPHITLTEMCFVPEIKDLELDIPKYSLIRVDFPRRRCGEVALYIKDKLGGAALADKELATHHLDMLLITSPFARRDRSPIGLIYRHPPFRPETEVDYLLLGFAINGSRSELHFLSQGRPAATSAELLFHK